MPDVCRTTLNGHRHLLWFGECASVFYLLLHPFDEINDSATRLKAASSLADIFDLTFLANAYRKIIRFSSGLLYPTITRYAPRLPSPSRGNRFLNKQPPRSASTLPVTISYAALSKTESGTFSLCIQRLNHLFVKILMKK